jgi:hypothetical protein
MTQQQTDTVARELAVLTIATLDTRGIDSLAAVVADPRKRGELQAILARHFRRSLAAGEGV